MVPELEALEMAYNACQAGAAGVDMGRNIFQSDCPTGMIQAVNAVVHQNETPKQAIKIYEHVKNEIAKTGRVFSYDVVGGRYEETDFASTGSGSRLAKSYMRTEYRIDMTADEAARLAVRALVSASQEDTATGGPDLLRGILPNVVRIDEGGFEELDDDVILPLAQNAVETIR